MDADYENILLVKNEVFVYQIPPRTSNRNCRAADWKLDQPQWTGRLRIISKSDKLFLKLEDRDSCALFAQCPVDQYPGPAIEAVSDSSRYFVIRVVSDRGDKAFVGIGFTDRGDSFDLNVALQDHFKRLKNASDPFSCNESQSSTGPAPKLDLSFKEGETIKINIAGRESNRPKKPAQTSGAGGIGLLPPPPGSSTRNRGSGSAQAPLLPPPPGSAASSTSSHSVSLVPQKPTTAASSGDEWSDFFGQQLAHQAVTPSIQKPAPHPASEESLLQF